jgi:hypothetical protein
MPTIVNFPTIVQEALTIFGDGFDTEAARRHFAEYLTGLMVAERKTVRGINREFVITTDQSCLNRWLTEVSWDVQTLNDRRLAWLQRDPKTRYSPRGVIASIGKIQPLFTRAHPPASPRLSPMSPLEVPLSRPSPPAASELGRPPTVRRPLSAPRRVAGAGGAAQRAGPA